MLAALPLETRLEICKLNESRRIWLFELDIIKIASENPITKPKIRHVIGLRDSVCGPAKIRSVFHDHFSLDDVMSDCETKHLLYYITTFLMTSKLRQLSNSIKI